MVKSVARQLCLAKSSGVRGSPWRARYAGLAHTTRRLGASLRAASEESARSAMRTARSKPSSTTLTVRSERLRASCTSGIALGELRYERCDVLMAKRGGQGDAQHAARLGPPGGHRGVRLLDVGEHPVAGLIVGGALVGEVEAAGGAVHQAHSQPGLKRRKAGGSPPPATYRDPSRPLKGCRS